VDAALNVLSESDGKPFYFTDKFERDRMRDKKQAAQEWMQQRRREKSEKRMREKAMTGKGGKGDGKGKDGKGGSIKVEMIEMIRIEIPIRNSNCIGKFNSWFH
jgi:hypothetical protein